MAGRPPIPIDIDQLAKLMRFRPSKDDCAAFFKCSTQAIDAAIERAQGIGFKEFRDRNMVHVRFGLIQKAQELALQGDRTMLIFCLKNLCGWNDNPIQSEAIDIPRAVINVIGHGPRLSEGEPAPLGEKTEI